MKTIDDNPDDSNTVILCFSSIKISGTKIEIVSRDIHFVNAEAGFQTDAIYLTLLANQIEPYWRKSANQIARSV